MLLLGACGGLLLALAAFASHAAQRPFAYAQAGSILALGALGGLLALAGWKHWRGAAPPPVVVARPPVVGRRGWTLALVVAYVVALAGGQIALARDFAAWLVLPVAHVVAGLAPIACLAAWAIGRPARFSSARASAHLALGAWGTGIAALVLEGAVALAVAAAAAFGVASEPDGIARLRDLLEQVRSPGFLGSQSQQVRLLLNPWVIGGLAFMAAVVAPLAEESFKAIGVPLAAMFGAKTESSAGFLGGLFGGAGYAWLENMLAAGPGADFWAGSVLVRLGPLVMHAATGALVGWGWAQAISLHRPGRLAAAYLGALVIHGSWNLAVVGIVYAAAQIMVSAGNPLAAVFWAAAAAALGAWVVMLFVGCAVGLGWGASRVR